MGLKLIHVSKRDKILFRQVRIYRFVLFVLWISNFNLYLACDYLSMLELTLIHVSKKGLDSIKIGKVWSIRVIYIRRFGNLSSRLHVSKSGTRTLFDWKYGVSVFHSCNIRIVWGLWPQSNFHEMIISIINIFWLHWIINRLVMHPYALSHNKAVLNWNNFVWSIRPTLVQGLIASRSNKQQPTDAVS